MKCLKLAYCNKTKEVILNVHNHGGNPYTADANITCELVSATESSDMVQMCHVEKTYTEPGEYKVNFQPTNIGK